MSNYSTNEKVDQLNGCGPGETEELVVFLSVSPVLTFASGADAFLQQREGESSIDKNKGSKTVCDQNWTRKTPMGAKHQDTVLDTKAGVDINSNLLLQNSVTKPGIDHMLSRTNEQSPPKRQESSRRPRVSYHDPSSPPLVQRNRPLGRTLSTPTEEPENHAMPNMKRRLSDPLTVSRENRQQGNRKIKSSLIRRVSPLQLLSKVTTNSNAKHLAPSALAPRIAKRLYPTISKALYGQLNNIRDRGGSDPSINLTYRGPESEYDPLDGGYDFPSQIHYLAEDIEKLNVCQYESTLNFHKDKIRAGEQVKDVVPLDEGTSQVFFKEDDVKLQGFIEDILRAHVLAMTDYKPASCDRTSRSICKLITNFLSAKKTPTHGQQSKFACLVYIGAVRDQGIHMASQALWNSEEDSFAAASFRNDSVYGLAVVIATPIN